MNDAAPNSTVATTPTDHTAPLSRYHIKPTYQHRTENATLEDEPGDYWNPVRLLLSRHAQHAVYQLAARLANQHRPARVLDVGCGLGHKLVDQLSHLPEVIGVDQPTCVHQARQLHPPGTPVRFVAADLEQPDTTDLGLFDLILSVDVIEHLLDPDMLLTFLKAHAAPQATMIISTPERDVRRGTDNTQSPKAEHVREWNRPELKSYFQSSGLTVTQHLLLPAFSTGLSRYMIKERWRLIRKRIPLRYTQAAVCQLA